MASLGHQLSWYSHASVVSNFYAYGREATNEARDKASVDHILSEGILMDQDDTNLFEVDIPLLGSPRFIPVLSKENDRIVNLPGLNFDPGFEQYAGYFSVSHKHQRNIFYWYVESQNNPETDPVILWTNGGPGCSGLVGFGTEHGPFYFQEDGTLEPNPYSWNRLANILYVEQPAGVGFSYSEKKSDYKTGDAKAASDNFKVIRAFFERFPERRSNDFYISSESYGGHYMPQLTLEILDQNQDNAISFKGMMVGNPYVDPFSNSMTMFQEWYHHGLLPWPLYNDFVRHCQDSKTYRTKDCLDFVSEMYKVRGSTINPYGLDYPMCLEKQKKFHRGMMEETNQELRFGAEAQAEESVVVAPGEGPNSILSDGAANPVKQFSSQATKLLNHTMPAIVGENDPPFLPGGDHYQPCADLHFKTYLNRKDVVEAIHANPKVLPWRDCSNLVHYSMKDADRPQIDLYKKILKMMDEGSIHLKLLVFSGDDDSVCSLAGTQSWIWDLGAKPKKHHTWEPWTVVNQTAGFMTQFHLQDKESSFVFATVHGAGHEVPSYRPMEALELLRKYLQGDW